MDLPFTWLDIELILRVLLSVGLGGIIGYEREVTNKPAGLRTHIFVAMGACLFTISSFYLLPKESSGIIDATRIAAGIVAGISFIGAGSIIASQGDIRGLTTAACLWVVAAIGLMIGLGNYLLPIITTIVTYFVLRLGVVEKRKLNKK
jgi:putative Mg2+ transporter-C (MgtC) family protein